MGAVCIQQTQHNMKLICLFAAVLLTQALAIAGDPALPGFHPLNQAQAGRVLISELRCAACHAGIDRDSVPEKLTPDLREIGGRVVDEDIIRKDIGYMLLHLEDLRNQQISAAKAATKEKPLSEKEHSEAMQLLSDPNLTNRIVTDWLSKYMADVRPWLAGGNGLTGFTRNRYSLEHTNKIFLNNASNAMRQETLRKLVKGYMLKAGITKPGSCHILRHTAATLHFENGADIRSVQALLDHVSLNTTQIYMHVTIDLLRAIHDACHPVKPDKQP
jgi:hypothetical protein